MIDHYRMFADYNRWANDRVYTAAASLTDAEYRAHKGAFFGSLHATLNHLLVADRVWMKRFTGEGAAPKSLDTIIHADLGTLRRAREAEDRRIVDWIDGLELAVRLRARQPHLPIALITADRSRAVQRRARMLAIPILAKPAAPDELERWLARQESTYRV